MSHKGETNDRRKIQIVRKRSKPINHFADINAITNFISAFILLFLPNVDIPLYEDIEQVS